MANNVNTLIQDLEVLPSDIATRILNNTPYDILNEIFTQSANLKGKYYQLFKSSIEAFKSGEIATSEEDYNKDVEEIENKLGNIYTDMTTYSENTDVVEVDDKILKYFPQLTIKVKNVSASANDILVNGILLYALDKNLITDTGYMEHDPTLDALFSSEYTEHGISTTQAFNTSLIPIFLSNHVSMIDDALLSDYDIQQLFKLATDLVNKVKDSPMLKEINPPVPIESLDFGVEADLHVNFGVATDNIQKKAENRAKLREQEME